jgi:mono/diheme cytochrome c family protein
MKENRMTKKLLILCSVLILIACDRDRNHPGWDYFPDMFYSTAYETYSPNPNFRDGMTMRTPVPGSIPRGVPLENYTLDPNSRARAGDELVNPVPVSEEAIARGKDQYTIFCELCHGPSGAGDGQLFKRGLYPLKPRPVIGPADTLRDGHIFHTITLGFGSMGAYGQQVETNDRWKIIHYIRTLQAAARDTVNERKKNN